MMTVLVVQFFAIPALGVSLLLATVRLAKGPTLADRIVALDFMSAVAMAMVATYAVESGNPVVLEVAIVLALISFLGTVAFAFYVFRGHSDV